MARPTRRIRFYNAGDRIQCTLRYSDPTGHDIHCIANYMLDAPEGGFFTVPEETELSGATIRLSFDRDIARDYGDRGVIQIDANYEPPRQHETYFAEEDEDHHNPLQRALNSVDNELDDRTPVARNDEEAKAKGIRKWKAFVAIRVKEFMEQCEMIRSVGGVPRPATGATLRYLKIMGMVDPSEAMLRAAQKQTSVVEDLAARLDRLEKENRELKADQEDAGGKKERVKVSRA